jgi:hypothetical protein
MPESQTKPSRRGFMLGAAAAASATAAVVTLPQVGGHAPAAPAAKAPAAPENGGGYHVSEHVKRYYKSTLV